MSNAKAGPTGPNVDEVRSAIDLMNDLMAIMNRELELLRALRIKEFGALQERKLALIDSYEAATAALRSDPEFARHLDPVLQSELRDVGEKMQDVLGKNQSAISAARELNHRVAREIVAALQAENPEIGGYSDQGEAGSSGAAAPISVQIDGRY